MASILDIDLDYFNLVETPVQRLHTLLLWAERPVTLVVDRHHDALRTWRGLVKKGALTPPTHILHVDEHHDMMDEKPNLSISNVMYHAMAEWPNCRVYWMVEERIDGPNIWLECDTWCSMRRRFKVGNELPCKWPKPDLVSICTSPEFVDGKLRQALIEEVGKHRKRMRAEPRNPGEADKPRA